MAAHEIAVINLSRRLRAEDVMAMVDAIDRKMATVVCPLWKVPYRPVNYFDSISKMPPLTTDPVFILDTPGRRDVWGEHFRALTPAARVYCDPIFDGGDGVPLRDPDDPQRPSVAAVLDHEVGELTVDPDLDRYAIDAVGDEWDLEPYDMVQRYQIDATAETPAGPKLVALSDLVTPAFFRVGSEGPWNLDTTRPLPGPFTLGVGGYAMKNGDPVYARRADGGVTYPPGWWLASHIAGRSARRALNLEKPRVRFV